MTKSKIFFWLLASFIVGVAVASFVPVSLPVVWAAFVVGAAILAYGIYEWPDQKRAIVVGGAIFMMAFGWFRFLQENRLPVTELRSHLGEQIAMPAILGVEPIRAAKNQRLIVETNAGDRVLLVTGLWPEYRYGDALTISGELKEPENFSDSFDYQAYLAKDGVYTMMSFPKIEIIARDQGSRAFAALLAIKHAFSEKLSENIPEPQASFMAGLILGERRSLPKEITQELQTTGTSHIVALSGYNITIIGSALMKTLTFLFLPFSWALGLAVAGIIAFTVVTGAQASAVRAAIMGVLAIVARRAGRQYRMRNALTLAAALMLAQNPKILRFDSGFELSFLATLGLVFGSPLIDRAFEQVKLKMVAPLRRAKLVRDRRDFTKREKKSLVREILVTTLSAQLFVLPILVYQFGKLSLVSPLANLAVLPFIPFTMFLGFLTGTLGFASEILGGIAGWASSLFLAYELGAIHVFSRFPFAAVEIPGVAPAVIAGIYVFIIAWLWHKNRHAR